MTNDSKEIRPGCFKPSEKDSDFCGEQKYPYCKDCLSGGRKGAVVIFYDKIPFENAIEALASQDNVLRS